MHITLIDETEAPARPGLARPGKRYLEMVEVLDLLVPGKVVRVASTNGEEATQIRRRLLEIAATRGQRVSIWEHADGAIYASLTVRDGSYPPEIESAANGVSKAPRGLAETADRMPSSLLTSERRDQQLGLIDFATLYERDDVFQVATDLGPLWVHADDTMVSRLLQRFGTWQPEEAAFIRSLIRPGMNVVDIGAMIGYFSVFFAQAVGPTGRVLSLEPEPRNFALLCANLRSFQQTNAEPIRAAAARSAGMIAMSLSADNFGNHRAFSAQSASDIIEVEGVHVDDLLRPEARIDLVKIDAQGMDHVAVQGLERTIRRHRPVVLVEFAPSHIEEFGDRPSDVLAYYRSLGYSLSLVSQPTIPLRIEDDQGLPEAVRSQKPNHTDFVLRPITDDPIAEEADKSELQV